MSLFNFFFPEKIEYDGKNFALVYSSYYDIYLGDHVFPGNKFSKIYELICLDEHFSNISIHEPMRATREDLELVHTKEYLDDLLNLKITDRTKYSELPLNDRILDSFLHGVGGTLLATNLTETYQFVFNLGGGLHQSFSDHAEGFCYLNDVAIAATNYLEKNSGKQVLIIDLDVHQGNGTAHIFKENKNVFTFSMHQDNLYPKKEVSDFDIPLEENITDSVYLKLLDESLEKISKVCKPDIIYYLAGADPYEGDRLGNIKLTFRGLKERDEKIRKFAVTNNSKVVILAAGGYARNFMDTVKIHYQTAQIFARK